MVYFCFFASLSKFFYNIRIFILGDILDSKLFRVNKYNLFRCLGLGNGILTSSVYIVEVVSATRRGSVVMVGGLYIMSPNAMWGRARDSYFNVHLHCAGICI